LLRKDDAGHAGKTDVREQDIETPFIEARYRRLGVRDEEGIMPENVQHLAEQFASTFVIFHYKNLKRFLCHFSAITNAKQTNA
jgi:hypothetical protein